MGIPNESSRQANATGRCREGSRARVKVLPQIPLVVLLLVGGHACGTTQGIVQGKLEGNAVVYPVKEEQAWEIARVVLSWNDSQSMEERRHEHLLLGSLNWSLFSYGSLVGIWIDPIDADQTKVTILTKKRLATTVLEDRDEGKLHRHFAWAVQFV